MRNGLRISDFTVTIDLDCSSLEYTTPSILVITFDFVEFIVEVSKSHFSIDILTTVKYSSIGNLKVDQFPNNAYTEIIAKGIKLSPLKEKLTASLSNKWSEMIQKLFETSVKVVKFPELCYYCP